MKTKPFYSFMRRHLKMSTEPWRVPDSSLTRYRNDNGLSWIRKSISWDRAHPVRYRLWRIYVVATTDPRQHYRYHISEPITKFIQRGRRGWSVYDTWSIDHYLSKIIPEMVEYLRDHDHGYPSEFAEPPYGDGSGFEAWKNILSEIAAGFRAHYTAVNMEYIDVEAGEHYDHEIHKPVEEELMKVWEKGAKLFVKYYGNLWD